MFGILALMPFLAVSPRQMIFQPPFYYGFIYFALWAWLGLQIMLRSRPLLKWDLINAFLTMFVLINILSLMVNWNIINQQSISGVGGFKLAHIYGIFITGYLFMNVVTVWIIRKIFISEELFDKAVKIIVFSSMVAAVWGIVMVIGHLIGWLKEGILPLNFFPRLTGTATEPQVFGNFLLFGWPLSLSLLVKKSSFLNQFAVFILSLSLVMTFSMGAWMSAAAGLLVLGIFNYKNLSMKLGMSLAAILIMIICCVMLLSLLYPPYVGEFNRNLSKLMIWNLKKEAVIYKESIKHMDAEKYQRDIVNRFDDKLPRMWMAQTALNEFAANPILGVGPGNYGFLYNEYKPAGTPRKPYLEKAHNAYLEILAETGIFGLAVFLIMVMILLARARPQTILGMGCYASFLALLFHGLSFGILAHNYFWLAIGLIGAQKDLYA